MFRLIVWRSGERVAKTTWRWQSTGAGKRSSLRRRGEEERTLMMKTDATDAIYNTVSARGTKPLFIYYTILLLLILVRFYFLHFCMFLFLHYFLVLLLVHRMTINLPVYFICHFCFTDRNWMMKWQLSLRGSKS